MSERFTIVATKDAPATDEAGELLAGPWRSRAFDADGNEVAEHRGALTRWGSVRGVKRLLKRHRTKYVTTWEARP